MVAARQRTCRRGDGERDGGRWPHHLCKISFTIRLGHWPHHLRNVDAVVRRDVPVSLMFLVFFQLRSELSSPFLPCTTTMARSSPLGLLFLVVFFIKRITPHKHTQNLLLYVCWTRMLNACAQGRSTTMIV